jgi:hypothetical protein
MITVDGVSLEWDGTPMTIYQFLAQKGIVVPCFCFHEKLELSGNCRMCLVEANGAVVVSCSVPMASPLQIFTESERLSHCRENVMEFLLANHPLDCPICDQGGECDLQDISKTFGLDRGRFYESKRSVDNLNGFSAMVKTVMTRCIHCSRCVRFLAQYCDHDLFGLIGRGGSTEIGSFIQSVLVDEALSANIIDLCPVGALLSMPYSFTARPWELKSIESIDIMDSMAGGVRFDVAHNQLMRCQPVVTEPLNEDWITNKARFVYYNLQRQTALTPSLKVNNQWTSISWRQAAILFLEAMLSKGRRMVARTGNFVDLETAALLKAFCADFAMSPPCHENIKGASAVSPSLYLFNSSLEQLQNTSLLLLLGSNLRKENPLMYLRVRRNYLNRRSTDSPLKVLSIGSPTEYDNFPVIQLGVTVHSLELFLEGRLNGCKELFFPGFRDLHRWSAPVHPEPKMIVGPAIFQLSQAAELQHRLWNFAIFWRSLLGSANTQPIYNAALDYLGKISMFAVNCVNVSEPAEGPRVFWHFMTERLQQSTNEDFVIYQGYTLPSNLAAATDLFLPTAAPLERQAHYLNVLGWVRCSRVVLSPLKTTYTDPQILRFLHRFAIRFMESRSLDVSILKQKSLTFPWAGDFNQGFWDHFSIKLAHNWCLSAEAPGILVETPAPLENVLITLTTNSHYYGSDVFSRLSPILSSCLLKCIYSNFALRLVEES